MESPFYLPSLLTIHPWRAQSPIPSFHSQQHLILPTKQLPTSLLNSPLVFDFLVNLSDQLPSGDGGGDNGDDNNGGSDDDNDNDGIDNNDDGGDDKDDNISDDDHNGGNGGDGGGGCNTATAVGIDRQVNNQLKAAIDTGRGRPRRGGRGHGQQRHGSSL